MLDILDNAWVLRHEAEKRSASQPLSRLRISYIPRGIDENVPVI